MPYRDCVLESIPEVEINRPSSRPRGTHPASSLQKKNRNTKTYSRKTSWQQSFFGLKINNPRREPALLNAACAGATTEKHLTHIWLPFRDFYTLFASKPLLAAWWKPKVKLEQSHTPGGPQRAGEASPHPHLQSEQWGENQQSTEPTCHVWQRAERISVTLQSG